MVSQLFSNIHAHMQLLLSLSLIYLCPVHNVASDGICLDLLLTHMFVTVNPGPVRRNLPDGVRWDPAISAAPDRDWSEAVRLVPLDRTYEELQTHLQASVNVTHRHEH